MKLRTLVPVTYNSGVTETTTDIVEGVLINVSLSGDGEELGANYVYTTEPDEIGNVVVISQDAKIIKGDQIDQLYTAIAGDIPQDLNYRATERYKNYLGFRFLMAQTFGITPDEIEIVS